MVLAGVEHRSVVEYAAPSVVEAADELAHDDEVDAGSPRRTEVRVDVELASESDQALLGVDFTALPTRAADSTEQDGVGVQVAETGHPFPTEPIEQLRLAIAGVRLLDGQARRRLPQLQQDPHDLGTAVNVQTMVFGNMGDDSGTGVAFTRDPPPASTRSTASSW